MGQGDAHIIECKMVDEKDNTIYEYAFVDLGTSSSKTDVVEDKIWKIIGKGQVSHIFLTHPDKDHISYLETIKPQLVNGCQKKNNGAPHDIR